MSYYLQAPSTDCQQATFSPLPQLHQKLTWSLQYPHHLKASSQTTMTKGLQNSLCCSHGTLEDFSSFFLSTDREFQTPGCGDCIGWWLISCQTAYENSVIVPSYNTVNLFTGQRQGGRAVCWVEAVHFMKKMEL
jgi:hypothetical protein